MSKGAVPPPPKTPLTPPPPPPGVGIPETRGGGIKELSSSGPRRRPLSAQVVKLMSERIQGALSDITSAYPEVRQWCYVLPYRSTDKPLVQISDPSDPTGQTVLKREELSRSLEREVCRRMDRAYDELAGAANWLRHVQEYGE